MFFQKHICSTSKDGAKPILMYGIIEMIFYNEAYLNFFVTIKFGL